MQTSRIRWMRLGALVGVLSAGLLVLPAGAEGGLIMDEILVRYPAGFTRALAWDVGPALVDPELQAGLIEPLRAANHPLAGLVRTIEFFRISPEQVAYVVHGQGPEVSSFSQIVGPGRDRWMGALRGLQAAAQAPNSPFTRFEWETLDGVSVAFVEGTFGPVALEWAYIPTEGTLWIGTEVAFLPGRPDEERLRKTTRRMVDKLLGRRTAGTFSELAVAVSVRGGDLGFVRLTEPQDRPQEPGEQAMGFRMTVGPEDVVGRFVLRFASRADAQAAAQRLREGTSPYLAQDLYRAELVGLQQEGRTLLVEVQTDLRGLVGLLLLVMPF